MNADGKADVVGIAFDGGVWVATSNATGTGFNAPVSWGSTVFRTADNWFINTYRQRVWVTDVNHDGKGDLVGIADGGNIYLYTGTGAPFAASPTISPSVFSPYGAHVGDGWFDPPGSANPNSGTRVWLADVTGDGLLDFVGIGNAGDIWISKGTGTGFASPMGPYPSDFSTANGWFSSNFRDRLFVADVVDNGGPRGIADIVGVGFSGQIEVAAGLSGGGFGPTHTIANTVFGNGWFDTSSQPRVFVADVSGDGRSDVVGIAPNGHGDGDVWVARSTGTGFVQKVWLYGSKFKTVNESWFVPTSQQRVWVSDVTGDGRADVVGVANSGDVWVARATSAEPTGSTTDPSPGSYFFQPALRVATSGLIDGLAGGFFSTNSKRRVWLADVTADGVNDLLAIAPTGAAGWGDGALLWTQVFPTAVTSFSAVAPDGAPHPLQVGFSRHVDCSRIGPSLTVTATASPSRTATLTPPVTPPTNATLCPFTVTVSPAASGVDVTIVKQLEGLQMTDRWGQPIDGNGNGFLDGVGGTCDSNHDTALSIDYVSGRLWANASTVSIGFTKTTRVNPSPDPPFPAGQLVSGFPFITCPDYDGNGLFDDCPESKSRVVVVGNATRMLVLVATELIGINPGRLRELIQARTGISASNIVITATHSHGVPRTIKLYTAPTFDDRTYEGPSPSAYTYPYPYPYLQWIEDTIATQVANTYMGMVPATVSVGSEDHFPADTSDFASVNRWFDTMTGLQLCNHDSPTPVNNLKRTLSVVALHAVTGAPIALLVNYPLHPVIASGENIGMNTDFPGFLSKCLETDCGGTNPLASRYAAGLFIQSGSGDVNPANGDVWYDVNTASGACQHSGDLGFCKGQKTIQRVRYYGEALAHEALRLSNTLTQNDSTGMTIKVMRNVTPTPGISSCDNDNGCFDDETRPDGTAVTWELESTSVVVAKPTMPLFAFATIPGEPYSTLQGELTQASPAGPNTFLFGYANGYFGYFPDAQARQCVNALASPPDTRSCTHAATGMCSSSSPTVLVTGSNNAEDSYLCYSAATCSDGTKSIATGPTYFGASSDGVGSSAGEKLAAVGISQIAALCQQR
jgi:hypothetical protein